MYLAVSLFDIFITIFLPASYSTLRARSLDRSCNPICPDDAAAVAAADQADEGKISEEEAGDEEWAMVEDVGGFE